MEERGKQKGEVEAEVLFCKEVHGKAIAEKAEESAVQEHVYLQDASIFRE